MKRKNATRRALLGSVVSLLLCCSMLVGTTFAWFTDSVTSTGNIIKSGTLGVEMLWAKENAAAEDDWTDASDGAIFNYQYWEPGYTQVRYVKLKNAGDLAFKFQLNIVPAEESAAGQVNLADVIEVRVADVSDGTNFSGRDAAVAGTRLAGTLSQLMVDPDGAAYGVMLPEAGKGSDDVVVPADAITGQATYCIVLHMQESAGNEYQNQSVGKGFSVQLLATQMTYEKDSFDQTYDNGSEYLVPETADEWDGTADISWYSEEVTEFSLSGAEQLVGLAKLVDAGNTFAGKTVKLTCDANLYLEGADGESICFNPIGSYKHEKAFKGTFDGQGHTIYNMSQNTWALNNGYYYGDLGLGLFGLVEDATIKNLTMDGAFISGESALCGTVAGVAYGDCVFENITVSNASVADYQYYAGGIVGWASGNHQYINCDVDASSTIAAQWGDFDNSVGGIIGGAGGSAAINLKDCDVACRIDAYNDVTSSYQWYAYRRCGMLIGNTGKTANINGTTYAAAPQLTAENCTVTYGEWANYTYCEFAGKNWPYVRVQAGVSNSAYSNPRYGHPTDANGNEVVDDSHVHNEGEDHFILCAFDQLYGGGQGVYGTAAHDGVNVIYNNK